MTKSTVRQAANADRERLRLARARKANRYQPQETRRTFVTAPELSVASSTIETSLEGSSSL